MKNALLFVVVSAILLTGCGSDSPSTSVISNNDVVLAQEFCKDHAGFKEIRTFMFDEPQFVCGDGAKLGTRELQVRMYSLD